MGTSRMMDEECGGKLDLIGSALAPISHSFHFCVASRRDRLGMMEFFIEIFYRYKPILIDTGGEFTICDLRFTRVKMVGRLLRGVRFRFMGDGFRIYDRWQMVPVSRALMSRGRWWHAIELHSNEHYGIPTTTELLAMAPRNMGTRVTRPSGDGSRTCLGLSRRNQKLWIEIGERPGHTRAMNQSSLMSLRHIVAAATGLATISLAHAGATPNNNDSNNNWATPAPNQPTDKSLYNLFNMTPGDKLRPVVADANDGVVDATTVDAGHAEIQGAAIDYFHYETSYGPVNYTSETWGWAPRISVGVLDNLEVFFHPYFHSASATYSYPGGFSRTHDSDGFE